MAGSEATGRTLAPESEGLAPARGRLKGRRILIVGGGQRIVDVATDPIGNGRAMSVLFAREGAHVVVADRDASAAHATAELIVREGGRADVVVANIRKPDDVVRMVAEAHAHMGAIDGLMLNVGIGVGSFGLAGTSPSDWDATLEVNVRGPMLICKAALPLMEDGSAIVFTSSIAGIAAITRLPAYDASKAALAGLMRHVALEGSRRGIRANIVMPGLVDTPVGRMGTKGRPARAETPVPLGRHATGWEIAYAALFFMSNESAYATAQIIAIDGGLTGIS